MSVTQADLQDFHHFACERIANGGADLSLSAIVAQWDARREREEVHRLIQEAIPDIEAERGKTIQEVDVDIREKLGFPPRSA